MAFSEVLIFDTVPGPTAQVLAEQFVPIVSPPQLPPSVGGGYSTASGTKAFTTDAEREIFVVTET